MNTDLLNLSDLSQTFALMEQYWAFRASRALLTAHQLGVFEALREPGTAGEVADRCQTDPTATEKLLTVCCALGVVERNGDTFALTQLARELLLEDSPRTIVGTLNHAESLWWFWTGLPEVVRTGRRDSAPSPPEPFASRRHEHWIWAMHGIAANGVAQWIAESVDLSGRRRLLDVGGGPGTYSIVLCQRYPELTAVVWDLPETIAIARQVIERFGMAERVSVQEGNWDTDEFGEGYDCVLMSNILHGAGSRAGMKLEKAKRALVAGGLLIAHDFLMNDDRTGPLGAALFNMMVGAYTVGELVSVIRSVGFVDVRLVASDDRRGAGLVTAVRPEEG